MTIEQTLNLSFRLCFVRVLICPGCRLQIIFNDQILGLAEQSNNKSTISPLLILLRQLGCLQCDVGRGHCVHAVDPTDVCFPAYCLELTPIPDRLFPIEQKACECVSHK